MLATDTRFQGNGFKLKDFVINRFAKTLFDAGGIAMILGTAMPNTNEVRKKPNGGLDWRLKTSADGTPKLVKLYEYLGLSRDDKEPDKVVLTREAFTAASTGRRVSPSSQRPNNLLDASMSRLR